MTAAVSEPAAKPSAAIPSRPPRKGPPVGNQVGAIPVVTPIPIADNPAPAAVIPVPQPTVTLPQDAMQALLSTLNVLGQSMQTLNTRMDKMGSPQSAAASPLNVPDRQQVDLMQRAVDTQRPNGYAFQLLVVPEDGYPTVEQFITIEGLITRIKAMLGKSCYLFPGVGQSYTITRGPMRHLQTPMGAFPLFDLDAPEAPAASLTGWVGDVVTEEELETEAANALAELDGEEEAEEPDEPAAPAR